MDFGSEETLAHYFITGLLATIANSGLDPLSSLVEVKKLLDEKINDELERWANGVGADDE